MLLEPVEIEEAVVGACLIDPGVFWRVQEQLSPSMFASRWLGQAYAAVVELAVSGQPTTVDVVARRLEADGDDTWRSRLVRLVDMHEDAVGQATDLMVEIVDAWQRRRMVALSKRLAKGAKDGAKRASEVLAEAIAEIEEVTATDRAAEQVFAAVVDRIVRDTDDACSTGRLPGISTGVYTVDQLVGAIQPEDLIVLGGDSGAGKTALATQIALHVGLSGWVDFYSLDQTARGIGERVVAGWADVTADELRTGQITAAAQEAMIAARPQAENHRIRFIRSSKMTVREIKTRSLAHKRGQGLRLIIIDNLKRVSGSSRNKGEMERLAEVINDLRDLTADVGVPVILIAHRTRSSQRDTAHPEPTRHDLYGGGSIDETADVVLLTWRPELSEAWRTQRRGEEESDWKFRLLQARGRVQLVLDKHRARQVPKTAWMRFDGRSTTYQEIDE